MIENKTTAKAANVSSYTSPNGFVVDSSTFPLDDFIQFQRAELLSRLTHPELYIVDEDISTSIFGVSCWLDENDPGYHAWLSDHVDAFNHFESWCVSHEKTISECVQFYRGELLKRFLNPALYDLCENVPLTANQITLWLESNDPYFLLWNLSHKKEEAILDSWCEANGFGLAAFDEYSAKVGSNANYKNWLAVVQFNRERAAQEG